MPAITRWSRSIGCRWRGSSIRRASSSSGGAGQASGPSVATISSSSSSAAAQQLRPGALLGAELAQAKLAPVGEPDQHPGGAIAKRGALLEHLEAARRHQVDE